MASALVLPSLSISLFCRPPSSPHAFSHLFKTPSPFIPSRYPHQKLHISLPIASSKGPSAAAAAAAAEAFDSESYKEKEISRETLIWRAIKLPMYSVALIPLSVGSAAAYLQTGLFFTRRYLVLLFSSILIIAWLNLSNDVYDFDTGADKNKKESVVNIIGSRTVTLFAANTSLVLGFIGLVWASAEAGDARSIYLLTCAILCGYIYQCPPFRLSYQGLGEPLCLAAFGPFATTAFYLSQSSKRLSGGTLMRSKICMSLWPLMTLCRNCLPP